MGSEQYDRGIIWTLIFSALFIVIILDFRIKHQTDLMKSKCMFKENLLIKYEVKVTFKWIVLQYLQLPVNLSKSWQ